MRAKVLADSSRGTLAQSGCGAAWWLCFQQLHAVATLPGNHGCEYWRHARAAPEPYRDVHYWLPYAVGSIFHTSGHSHLCHDRVANARCLGAQTRMVYGVVFFHYSPEHRRPHHADVATQQPGNIFRVATIITKLL